MLIGMGSGSLSKELYDWFGYTSSTATASAFVQQRNKIRPEAVKMVFNEFVSSTTPTATFQGYRLFAVDGSDLRLPSDPTNDFSLIRNAEGQKQYNLAHLNAMFDLMSKVYVDATMQGKKGMNEHSALVSMVDQSKYTIGLACLHGKKTDFLLQEVFARLILYNYASLVARQIPAPQGKQINFSVAILACKQFLKGKIESTQIFEIEGVHATLCSILSDAVEGGFLSHNPAWRTYRYAGRKCEKKIADEETAQKIIAALEGESIKYETYFKLIIATGMRRDECCGLKWCDIDWEQRSIHICRNAVKVTDEDIFVKEPKTRAGNRYVYFSAEMESLLREYRQECAYLTETYDQRQLTTDDFLFRRQGAQLPMTPTTFTYRFKLILKKNGLPQELNVHSLRHTAASLMIAGGTDVATVMGILGHSQPSTTLDIYTHAFDKNKKAASAGLQEMLEI